MDQLSCIIEEDNSVMMTLRGCLGPDPVLGPDRDQTGTRLNRGKAVNGSFYGQG